MEHKQDCPWWKDWAVCDCHVHIIHNLEYEIGYYVDLLKCARNEFSFDHHYKMIDKIDDALKKFNR